ncbi:MAG: glycosyltransferase family 2 protein [Eubacteriales bacterium]|nr:glycosyltransferase family 2 protein [Eubacteriales bacterium]
MITISLCMIVKDEEAVLGRCLDSVKGVADEIVIVDTGSRDRTLEKAKQYTDQIYEYSWQEDFSAARNFAFSKGKMDYLMWLDADDVLPVKSREELRRLKESLPEKTDVVMLPYKTGFDEEGRCTFSYYRERLVKNHRGFCFHGRVHEAITPSGVIRYEDIPVEHHKVKEGDGGRNLRIYEGMEREGISFGPRELYYYGRELLSHGQFKRGEAVLEDFLEREDGWVENKIDGCRQLAACRYGLGDEKGALGALLWGLSYDVPRGELCCDLGKHFFDRGRYSQAVYWFEQALKAGKKPESGGFVQEECYGFLPAVYLCICHDRMGDWKKGERYNEMALQYKPGAACCIQNREYFRERGKNETKGQGESYSN